MLAEVVAGVLDPGVRILTPRIQASWRRWLDARLDDWDCSDPADRALLDQALENIATKLLDEQAHEREPVNA